MSSVTRSPARKPKPDLRSFLMKTQSVPVVQPVAEKNTLSNSRYGSLMKKENSLRSLFQKTTTAEEKDLPKPPQRQTSGLAMPAAARPVAEERHKEHMELNTGDDNIGVIPSINSREVDTSEATNHDSKSKRRTCKKNESSSPDVASESKRLSRSCRSERCLDRSRRRRSRSSKRRSNRKQDRLTAPDSPTTTTASGSTSLTSGASSISTSDHGGDGADRKKPDQLRGSRHKQNSDNDKSVSTDEDKKKTDTLRGSRHKQIVKQQLQSLAEETPAETPCCGRKGGEPRRRPDLSKQASAGRLMRGKKFSMESSRPLSRRNIAGMCLASPTRTALSTQPVLGSSEKLEAFDSNKEKLLCPLSPGLGSASPHKRAPLRVPSSDDILQLSFSGAARPAVIRRDTGGDIYRLVEEGDPSAVNASSKKEAEKCGQICQLCAGHGHSARECHMFEAMIGKDKTADVSAKKKRDLMKSSRSSRRLVTGDGKKELSQSRRGKRGKGVLKDKMNNSQSNHSKSKMSEASDKDTKAVIPQLTPSGNVSTDMFVSSYPGNISPSEAALLASATGREKLDSRPKKAPVLRAPTGASLDEMVAEQPSRPLLREPTGEGLIDMAITLQN